MRRKFDEQLQILSDELTKMGALCEQVIALASKALTEGDASLAEKIIPIDREIDQKERDIEAMCLKLFLHQQPVARDLRQISAALKMITDMERIGDQAADIAEITESIKDRKPFGNSHITAMARATIEMVSGSIEAYVKKDVALAKKVIAYDDVVDEYFEKIKKNLITLIAENPSDGEYEIDLLMIAKYFERIGDHATNIAEWVEFSITGIHNGELSL